ncbi:MAG: hypothetical protein KatS3mg097_088 [Candidatus Parcubacteria bacterium]|nr:MAG: hypothetical protein KatS3mg097_088 [Candidatus Parcubacteria bacterium]
MQYFVFTTKNIFNKGDKVAIICYDFDADGNIKEEIVEEFILNDYEYYEDENLLVINSPHNYNEEEFVKKYKKKELLIKKIEEDKN